MLSCKVQETPYFVELSGDYIIKIVSKVASITTVVFVASMCYGQCDAVFVNAESTLLWSSECSCSPENGGLDTMIFGMTVSHIENEAGPCGWGSQRSGCGTNANTFQIGGGVPIWAATIVCPEPYANDVIFCQHPSVPPPPPPDECFVFYDDAYCFTYGKMFALGGGLARTGFWHYNFAYGCYSKCD